MNRQWWAKMEAAAGSADDRRPGTAGWRTLEEAYRRTYRVGDMVTESKIEEMLARELLPRCEKWGFELIPQYWIGHYRYDFALQNKGTQELVALIECDGGQFHSSAEQRKRDEIKDLIAKKQKLALLRFSGREICADAGKCAESVVFKVYQR